MLLPQPLPFKSQLIEMPALRNSGEKPVASGSSSLPFEQLSISATTFSFRRFFLALIRFYQVRLSPYKRFTCPLRQMYGGLSCSAYVSELVESESCFSEVISDSFMRLKLCSAAANEMGSGSPRMKCWVIPCCFPL